MKSKEILERQLAGDARVFNEMQQFKINDKSFTEKQFFIFNKKYSQEEVRKIWLNGIELGLKRGIEIGSLTGQKSQLIDSAKNPNQKAFIDEFYKLSKKYNCAITYHPINGMEIIDL